MLTIAVSNQKGGVGKSTTAIALAYEMSRMGQKTLLIDLDPQANSSSGLGVAHENFHSYSMIMSGSLEGCIMASAYKGFDVVPSTQSLAAAEIELVPVIGREFRLKEALTDLKEEYEVVIIDTPPTLGLLTINALSAADYVLIPLQCEYFALEGLTQLLKTIELIKKKLNQDLDVLGILLTMFDRRNNLSHQVASQIEEYFAKLLFRTRIPRNVKIPEASSFGMPIQVFDPSSAGAKAYGEFSKEAFNRLSQGYSESPQDAASLTH